MIKQEFGLYGSMVGMIKEVSRGQVLIESPEKLQRYI
jgi:hypothetical protein